MAKRVDTSDLDKGAIISYAKPSVREKVLKPYDPSVHNPSEEKEQASRLPQETEEVETAKRTAPEEPKRRRSKAQIQPEPEDYETLFIRPAPSTTRSGKAVYIRKEFHDRIMRIVQNIGYNELSLFSYIDNVLEHHFNTYQDDISDLYRKRRPDDIF